MHFGNINYSQFEPKLTFNATKSELQPHSKLIKPKGTEDSIMQVKYEKNSFISACNL